MREPVTTGSGTAEEELLADEPPPALLRGLLTLNLSKPTRIKEINVKLKGITRTDWPEGESGLLSCQRAPFSGLCFACLSER